LAGALWAGLHWTLTAAVLGAALGLSALRLALPMLDRRPAEVATLASKALGYRVEFASLATGMRGVTPQLELRAASLVGDDGSVTRVAALRLRFDWTASLLARSPRLSELEIDGLRLTVLRLPDGRWQVAGMAPGQAAGGLKSWLLVQPLVRLRAASVEVADAREPARALLLEPATATLQRRQGRHWLDLQVGVGGAASGTFRLRAEIRRLSNDFSESEGRAYVTARELTGANVPFGRWLFGGQLNAETWLYWKDGRVERVHGGVEGTGRLQAADGAGVEFDALRLGGVWQRTADGWQAGLDQLRLEAGQRVWRLEQVYAEQRGERLAARGGLVDLAGVGPLAGLLAAADVPLGTRLGGLDPTLRARDWRLTQQVDDGGRRLRLAAEVDELGWQPDGGVPGLTGLAGELRLSESAASFELQGAPHLQLTAPSVYAQPLALDVARGTLTAQWSAAGVQAQLAAGAVRSGSIDLAARGRLSLPAQGEPELFIQAATAQAPAGEFFALLPDRALSAQFIDWGHAAIQAGMLHDVQALLRGDPRRFPFRGREGRFVASAGFSDIVLDYQPGAGWPQVAEGRGRFGLDGPVFWLTLDDGRLLGSRASAVQVRIPDVGAPAKRLQLDGVAKGPAQDVIRFIEQSPLAERFGSQVARLDFDGAASTRVGLDLVFTGPVKSTQVTGRTRLDGNTLTIADTGLAVQALRGEVGFDRAGLRAQAVQARLFGGPVVFDLRSVPGKPLRIEPRGQAAAAEVTRYLHLPWPELFSGPLPWQGGVDVAGDGTLDLDLNLELADAVRDLPPPLDVLQQGPLAVRAHCDCGAPAHGWEVTLAAQPLMARLDLAPAEAGRLALRRGDLAIGVEARLPSAGFNVHGRVAELALEPWLGWLAGHFGGPADGAWPSPRVDLYADRLVYLGQTFADTRLQVARGDGWNVAVDGAGVAGTVRVTGSAATQRVQLDLSRLYLARDQGAAGQGGASGVDPAAVPVLAGRIGDLRYDGQAFGALDFASRREPDGLDFDNLDLRGDYGRISGRGSWRGSAERAQSRLEASADFKDFGAFLAHFGVPNLVRGGHGELAADLAWPGSPGAFAFSQLSGRVSGELRGGTLPDLEPGLGRLFGILSIDSVVRRLTLDFRDVFGRGFAVDRMQGELELTSGQARLKDLRVRGPAAHLTLNGSTNLADRSLDVEVLVVPQVTSSLPLAGAIAAPGVGAAIYLGQKIFEGAIDKVTEQHYRVTGTWAEPKIARR
jgi:uncharacterized protein (TIGR02099 family)